jgi:hypothetical protein
MPLRTPSSRPTLAPLDALGRELQAVLELIRPHDTERDEDHVRYDGYCGAASEAYLHLSGGRDSGLTVSRYEQHWWLLTKSGQVIDLTLAPADRRELKAKPWTSFPYEKGTRAMFCRGYSSPSKRAQLLIDLVHRGRS